MNDIFGGVVDEARQRQNGHYWVGLGTDQEHCTLCRRGPTADPCTKDAICICGEHIDTHQSGRLLEMVCHGKYSPRKTSTT